MDIIAQLRIERDKAAQQVNALDMAIAALSGTTTSQGSRGRRKMSAAALPLRRHVGHAHGARRLLSPSLTSAAFQRQV